MSKRKHIVSQLLNTNTVEQSEAVNQGRETHSIFDTNHPTPPNNLPILPYSSHRVRRVPIPDPETVDDFSVRVRIGAVPEMFEVFGGDAVSVGGIAEDDHVDGFDGEAGRFGLGLRVGVGG